MEWVHTNLQLWQYITYSVVSLVLILFAGLMAGLTLGLLSIEPMNLELLQAAGSPRERKYAKRIIPVVKNHHLLLVTLLLCNSFALEALPLFLDKMIGEILAIILSVTFILIFGEILPQAVCSRYGLAIGAFTAPIVRVLIIVVSPIAYPIAKLLDCLLGKEHDTYFGRNQLKHLVSMHDKEKRGGPLLSDEISVIRGALEMGEKTVQTVMTPLASVYMLEESRQLDMDTMKEIASRGHSRVPIYRDNQKNPVGLLLVKQLIYVDPDDKLPISDIALRQIPDFNSSMTLWEALNIFQEGRSHIAAVRDQETDDMIGIVTLEDVLEELIQEEVVDETDVYVDVHKRIRVARQLVKNLSFKSMGNLADVSKRSKSSGNLSSPNTTPTPQSSRTSKSRNNNTGMPSTVTDTTPLLSVNNAENSNYSNNNN
eukprot:gb/GECH01011047.1/.p1 GENE.gb/GECH01011047.1/~~gb/GECH01011047.1/.p1  ORF type:complete len:427 (+),score=97.94 gb/GECH01011047.1/:1-1281(+)